MGAVHLLCRLRFPVLRIPAATEGCCWVQNKNFHHIDAPLRGCGLYEKIYAIVSSVSDVGSNVFTRSMISCASARMRLVRAGNHASTHSCRWQ